MTFQKIILLILIMLFNSLGVSSQDQRIEKARALGKDSIISIANDIITKKYPALKIDASDFTIKAYYNKKGVFVEFKRLFKFIPLNKPENYYRFHDLLINIITDDISAIDSVGIDSFYTPTDKEKKKIEFLKRIIATDTYYEITVEEKETSYTVLLSNEFSSQICNIDKTTGKSICMSGAHEPLVPIPEEDTLIEIKI